MSEPRELLNADSRSRLDDRAAGGWTPDGHTLVAVGDLRRALRTIDRQGEALREIRDLLDHPGSPTLAEVYRVLGLLDQAGVHR